MTAPEDEAAPRQPDPPPRLGPPREDAPLVSKWGLEWGDISQIRDRLKLTPTERLQVAQELVNAALRIRAQNGR